MFFIQARDSVGNIKALDRKSRDEDSAPDDQFSVTVVGSSGQRISGIVVYMWMEENFKSNLLFTL